MKEESVARKTVRTSFWAAIENFFKIGVQFIVSLILARLLCPADFGIIALLTIFIEISSKFVSCGFGNALIRKIDCTEDDYCTAFYFNVIVSILFYFILFIIAPIVAKFYEIDLLCSLLRFCGITIIIHSFAIVQNAILSKGLKAKKQAQYEISASTVSAFVGLVMAYAGCGIWSLVGQQISNGLTLVILLWLNTSWKPKRRFSCESMNYLWNFGSKILLASIISTIYRNIYSIVIGKFYNNVTLGLFNRGQSLAHLVPNIIESVFVKNSLPIFSQIQTDLNKLIHIYREYIKLSCFVAFPLVCLISALANPFINLVLTDKWSGCVVYLQIFALTSFIIPANSINLRILQTFGRTDYTLKAEIFKKSLGLLLVFALITLGPFWLALGKSLFDIVAYGINMFYAKKITGLKYRDQIKDIIPILLCSFMMYGVIYIIILFINNYLLQLVIGSVFGLITFVLLGKYLFKFKQFDLIMNLKRL